VSGVNVKLNYRASPEYMKQSESDDCALYILLFFIHILLENALLM